MDKGAYARWRAQIVGRENICGFGASFGIAESARCGVTLTTVLPSREINPMVRMFDLNQHLRTLQLRLDARSSDEAQIEIKVSAEKALVRFDASVLDAALVELVDNARTALAIGGRIIVRAKRVGRRLWVTVADTGKGMSPPERTAVLDGAHDTGLGQIRHFARSCHARFRLRSAVGRGTVAVLMIPLVLNVGLTRQAGSLAPAGRQARLHERRGRLQRGQPRRNKAHMNAQPVEPKPDIIQPLAPPETPAPPEPRETPMPNPPEIIPSQPDFVPGVPPEEYPASV